MTTPAELTSRLARAVADAGSGPRPADRLGEACRCILGADGVAVVLAATLPQRLTVCVTDDVIARVEGLQDVLGEGPGADAYRYGRTVVGRIGADDAAAAWPLFAEAALHAAGPLTVVAVPVPAGTDVLGVLTAYWTGTGHPAPDAELTTHLAAAAGTTLLRDPGLGHDLGLDAPDGAPTGVRAEVHRATGVLMARLRLSPDDALALLRARAYASGVTLDEVARQVLDRVVGLASGGRPRRR